MTDIYTLAPIMTVIFAVLCLPTRGLADWHRDCAATLEIIASEILKEILLQEITFVSIHIFIIPILVWIK